MTWLQLLQNKWAQMAAIGVIGIGTGLGLGYKLIPRPSSETVVKEVRVIDKELTERAIASAIEKLELEQKDVTSESETTKPDGTIIKTKVVDKTKVETRVQIQVVEKEVIKKEVQTVVKEEIKIIKSPAPLPNYSVGLEVARDVDLKEGWQYEAEVGYRVLGTSWITGSYNHQQKSVGLGIRIEF